LIKVVIKFWFLESFRNNLANAESLHILCGFETKWKILMGKARLLIQTRRNYCW